MVYAIAKSKTKSKVCWLLVSNGCRNTMVMSITWKIVFSAARDLFGTQVCRACTGRGRSLTSRHVRLRLRKQGHGPYCVVYASLITTAGAWPVSIDNLLIDDDKHNFTTMTAMSRTFDCVKRTGDRGMTRIRARINVIKCTMPSTPPL